MFQHWQALVSSSALDRTRHTIRFTTTSSSPTTSEVVAQVLELARVEHGLNNAFLWEISLEKRNEQTAYQLSAQAGNLYKILSKACADSNALYLELCRSAER